ncbi:hypothetical protein GTW98_29415 [Streptomyces sp. SID8375]|uniref:hypothetical protein n=1 Tax=unclassified Streptomyces TaxID=2593676 RepID=UPI00036C5F33|nr:MULTISPECIES: hypothetical protein [unclassified Streptomyces]MCR8576922.1 hypothetical protein [Streptomyces sp. Isolate_219]MYX10870.1 hypothetical protein [Streptomyces sp. SID8375]
MAEYASRDAAAALARAKELGSTVRNGTKWYVRYQVIYGCAAAVMVLSVGLLAPPHGVAIGTGIWVATIVALSVYAARQRVARRGFGRWHAGLITVWALLFLAVLIPGTLWHQGAASWWVPGAVVVALPGLIGGYMEARR